MYVGMILQEQKANSLGFCTTSFYTCGINVFSTAEKERKVQTLKSRYGYFQVTSSVFVQNFISWLLFLGVKEWEKYWRRCLSSVIFKKHLKTPLESAFYFIG